jgi:hypothetical protein
MLGLRTSFPGAAGEAAASNRPASKNGRFQQRLAKQVRPFRPIAIAGKSDRRLLVASLTTSYRSSGPGARSGFRPKSSISVELHIAGRIGYLPADPDIGPLLYEVIAIRHEKKATVITSN